jgi:hypothetical protein
LDSQFNVNAGVQGDRRRSFDSAFIFQDEFSIRRSFSQDRKHADRAGGYAGGLELPYLLHPATANSGLPISLGERKKHNGANRKGIPGETWDSQETPWHG